MNHTSILHHFNLESGLLDITLNRPERGNALNAVLVNELIELLMHYREHPQLRCLILQSVGKQFCTGADLSWMATSAHAPFPENKRAADMLSKCFELLAAFPASTLCWIEGHAMGGGVGLVACCDIAMAVPETSFVLPELEKNLLPSIIMPYLVRAIGHRRALAHALSATAWTGKEALNEGLIHYCEPIKSLEKQKNKLLNAMTSFNPTLVAQLKDRVKQPISDISTLIKESAYDLARARCRPEAQNKLKIYLKDDAQEQDSK